jgi:hypothetical protein
MKMMFWNIRGFGKPARWRQIRDRVISDGLEGLDLQETIKEDFTQRELSEIVGDVPFRWVWRKANGHSGGILMGVREDKYEVEDSEVGEFYASMVLRHRTTNYRWELITVYGPANHDKSVDFIAERLGRRFQSDQNGQWEK